MEFENVYWAYLDAYAVAVAFFPVNFDFWHGFLSSWGAVEGYVFPDYVPPIVFGYGFALDEDFEDLFEEFVVSFFVF